jgi:hypothetical protein
MQSDLMQIDEDLLDNPEISLAVAIGDHNFSDLKEFALGHDGAAMGSNNVVDGSPPQSNAQPSNLHSQSEPNTSTQMGNPVAETGSDIITPPANLELSLSHFPNPPTDTDLLQPQIPDNSSVIIEDIDVPFPESDAMTIDMPPLGTTAKNAEETINNDMHVDDQGEHRGKAKTGLLDWLKISKSKKRTRDVAEISSISSDESDSASKKTSRGNSISKKMKAMAGTASGPGLSRAATASRELRRKVQNGEFKPDPQKLKKWTAEIKRIDKDAEVDDKTAKDVRHSRCGRWYKVKEPYDTYRFRKHVNE